MSQNFTGNFDSDSKQPTPSESEHDTNLEQLQSVHVTENQRTSQTVTTLHSRLINAHQNVERNTLISGTYSNQNNIDTTSHLSLNSSVKIENVLEECKVNFQKVEIVPPVDIFHPTQYQIRFGLRCDSEINDTTLSLDTRNILHNGYVYSSNTNQIVEIYNLNNTRNVLLSGYGSADTNRAVSEQIQWPAFYRLHNNIQDRQSAWGTNVIFKDPCVIVKYDPQLTRNEVSSLSNLDVSDNQMSVNEYSKYYIANEFACEESTTEENTVPIWNFSSFKDKLKSKLTSMELGYEEQYLRGYVLDDTYLNAYQMVTRENDMKYFLANTPPIIYIAHEVVIANIIKWTYLTVLPKLGDIGKLAIAIRKITIKALAFNYCTSNLSMQIRELPSILKNNEAYPLAIGNPKCLVEIEGQNYNVPGKVVQMHAEQEYRLSRSNVPIPDVTTTKLLSIPQHMFYQAVHDYAKKKFNILNNVVKLLCFIKQDYISNTQFAAFKDIFERLNVAYYNMDFVTLYEIQKFVISFIKLVLSEDSN